jgi:crotonobetainyl-CoA:carnitine CoA-transferase CaiB-like acyl-CoA transferase
MSSPPLRALRGLRVLSLGLNLPAPVAAQQARQLGARVRKIEPPAGDPVAAMAPAVYAELHEGVAVQRLDLREGAGQRALQRELARADVLLTSFRPAALKRLGLSWARLRRAHPQLWQVAIVGSLAAPEEAGHDLTYQAQLGLVGDAPPPSLWADMAGAEAALRALHTVQIGRLRGDAPRLLKVGLQDALAHLAAPRRWGLTTPGGLLGGALPQYRVLRCADGRVAVAALEPHFAKKLPPAAELQTKTAAALNALAAAEDLPIYAWTS